MQKDFDNWNKEKKNINTRKELIFYRQREIWWCALGINIGFEQDGSDIEYRRPVLILTKTCFSGFSFLPPCRGEPEGTCI